MPVATPTVISDGITMDPMFELVSIDICKETGRIPWAILTLLDGSAATRNFAISDGGFFAPGKDMEIRLRYEGEPESEATIFKGLVVKQAVTAAAHGTLLTVEMKDPAIRLTQSRSSRVYREKTDRNVFEDLIAGCGLETGNIDPTETQYTELVKFDCTDWDFILSRADFYGHLVVADGGKISVRAVNLNEGPAQTFEFGIDEIYGFEMETDGTFQVGNVETCAWDLERQTVTTTAKAKAFHLKQGNLDAGTVAARLGGNLRRLSTVVPMEPAAVQRWADGAMVKSRLSMVRGCLSIPGTGKLALLDIIGINGIGERFNGNTLVTGINHRLGKDGWTTDLQFGLSPKRFIETPDIMDRPAAGHLPGVNGLQIGVVTDNKDPDGQFRVKISLPGIVEGDNEIWARLASPDAGQNRGFFFRPEPGDEVVVGFFNDDPRSAVVLGAMFNPINTAPQVMADSNEDNTAKGMVSRSGTTLAFMDGDKPSFFIKTPLGQTVTLCDDKERVEIKDSHGNTVTMNRDGITLKSPGNVKIEADGDVEIKGAKVDIK